MLQALQNDPILNRICERLKAAFNPVKIYLFGSRAQGHQSKNSDYDLVVVVKDSTEDWLERCQRANTVLRGSGAAVDVLVVTEAEFQTKSQENGSIYQIASSTGVELELG